jgi:ketosteroid isomerase-like protein
MNRRLSQRLVIATLAFLAGTATLSFGQSARPNAMREGRSATAEQQILSADTDRFKAMVNGDVTMLERQLAVELSYIGTTGRIEDKHAFLYGIKSGKTKYSSIVPSERQVHVMGTVATVIGVAVLRGGDAQSSDVGIRYTSVYVLRESRWQMMSCQSTTIAPNETVNPRRG